MAGYNQLKASIASVIKTNNAREITGQLLQNVLNQMVGVIGENLQLAGFADPTTNPGQPDQNIFYIAEQEGVYSHFNNTVLEGGLSFLMWKDGNWSSHTMQVVTEEYIKNHYVSIDFFRSIFCVYDENGNEILPNNEPDPILGTQEVIDNIKAQVGLWTEYYLSALGRATGGGGGGGVTSLDQLSDVTINGTPTNGQALVYNSTTQMWENQTIQAGTDMASVWAAFAAPTNEQINISHLTDALQNYLTQTASDQRYITIAYFDRLFRAYNGDTLVSHNDTTSTIDNIKAMFGFWTDMYLSALGRNSAATGLGIDNLTDVTINTPTDGQVLQYNATSSKWENATIQTVVALSGLTDVTLTSPAANQVLVYDGMQWVNSSLKTINGYSILGTGDIPASGGGTGNYLPLAGGTMTGAILSVQIRPVTDNSYLLGTVTYQYRGCFAGFINSGTNHALGIGANNSDDIYIDTAHNIGIGTITPSMPFHSAVNSYFAQGAKIGLVCIETTSGGVYDSSYAGEINVYSRSGLYLQYRTNKGTFLNIGGGNVGIKTETLDADLTVSGYAHISSGTKFNNICIECDNSIANTSARASEINCYNDGLYLQHNTDNKLVVCIGGGNMGVSVNNPSYKLHVSGTIYATGAITALSDMREKLVNEKADLPIEWIANAPAFSYYWKDKKAHDELLHVGSSAQYWRTVLPEVVLEAKDEKGTLSMQYGVAALVSAITIARKVVDHERRIQALENKERRLG